MRSDPGRPPYPFIDIDLGKVRANAATLRSLCDASGIVPAGVVKSALGSPEIAGAMMGAGIATIADSRLENLARLRAAFPGLDTLLLRLPSPSRADETVALADASLCSEPAVFLALDSAAGKAGIVHRVILMVDLGDLREGVLPEDVMETAAAVLACRNLRLDGLGANFGCLRGVLPTAENLGSLVSLAADLRRRFGIELPEVSGGNTFCLPLLESGLMPAGVNRLRVGAAIILAAAPTPPGLKARLHADACMLRAEIIELRRKAPLPGSVRGTDAFGKPPSDVEGEPPTLRAILALGRQDAVPEDLFPLDPALRVLGASSDHLVVDLGSSSREYRVGDELGFTLEYGAFMTAMTSPFVAKRYLPGESG